MVFDDPAFWRAGAISTIAVMTIVLIMLTIDSLAVISPGGSHVPPYTVINRYGSCQDLSGRAQCAF
jgi:nitric oxide reductase subunit C